MWKTIAPIVAGLGLFLTVPAPATEKSERGKSADGEAVRTVVLKGVLRHVKGAKTREPPIPFDYWTVHADGETYYLDLRGLELLERAEQLVNGPVVVIGIPDPASPTLRVTRLKADEFVKETIHVEIRGRLVAIRELHLVPDDLLPPRTRPRPPVERGPIIGWQIAVGEKHYQLEFGDRSELRELAKKLDGQGVVVTGTRVREVVYVSSMKADAGTYQETLSVEIQGMLVHRLVEGHEGEGRQWEITAAGKSYTLGFGRHQGLKELASQLENKTVVVTGTLKDGVVTVTSVRSADPDTAFERSAPLSLVEGCF
jgi:hypothetical protein